MKRAKHFLYVTTIIVNILINYLSYSITLKRKSRGIVCLSAGKQRKVAETGADLRGGCRGCAHPPPPPPPDDLRFSNTTGILQKKTMWFIGVEVEQETSAPPPKKNSGSAPEKLNVPYFTFNCDACC